MDEPSLNAVLCDMRKAQRLVVAFNQHMMPIIESMASQLNANFYYWEPQYNNNSCRGGTNPADKRKWNFSPLHNAAFTYLSDNVAGPHELSLHGYLLAFHLVTDTAIDDAFEKERKSWNPIEIEEAPETSKSVLRVYIYRSSQDGKRNNGWWNLYAGNPWPKCDGKPSLLKQGGSAMGIEIDIAELGSREAVDKVVDRIKTQFESNGFMRADCNVA